MVGGQICPRCLSPGRLVRRRRGGNTYLYMKHGNGRECYLGAERYVYATQFQPFQLRGGDRFDPEKLAGYLEALAETLKEHRDNFDPQKLERLANAAKRLLQAIQAEHALVVG